MTRALRWPVCDNPYTLKPLLWVDDYWSAVEMVNSELGSRNLYIGEPQYADIMALRDAECVGDPLLEKHDRRAA